MNELRFLEIMGNIGDDLIREADIDIEKQVTVRPAAQKRIFYAVGSIAAAAVVAFGSLILFEPHSPQEMPSGSPVIRHDDASAVPVTTVTRQTAETSQVTAVETAVTTVVSSLAVTTSAVLETSPPPETSHPQDIKPPETAPLQDTQPPTEVAPADNDVNEKAVTSPAKGVVKDKPEDADTDEIDSFPSADMSAGVCVDGVVYSQIFVDFSGYTCGNYIGEASDFEGTCRSGSLYKASEDPDIILLKFFDGSGVVMKKTDISPEFYSEEMRKIREMESRGVQF